MAVTTLNEHRPSRAMPAPGDLFVKVARGAMKAALVLAGIITILALQGALYVFLWRLPL